MARALPLGSIQLEDFKAFVGPNAEPYNTTLAARQTNKFKAGWVWLVFLAPPVWVLYRNLYGAFFAIVAFIVATTALDIYFGIETHTGTALSISLAMAGRHLVIHRASKFIAQANERGLTGEERLAFLQARGGVSPLAGWTAGILYVLLVALLVWVAIS